MWQTRLPLLASMLLCAASANGQIATSAAERSVDLKASDGTLLKATYFAARKPGPGVLLLHQVNRPRGAWDDLAGRLAAAGINTLTLDMRGHGESGGTPYDKLTRDELSAAWRGWPGDIDTAIQYLISQPDVKRDVIGVGGAGVLGVDNAVEVARRHPVQVKSLALLSGETFGDGLEFLREASRLPGLFVVADDDEYPPTVEAMELLYLTSTSPGKRLIHYSALREAPWEWYEIRDLGKVASSGGHGTDLFKGHPELIGIIVDWFVTTLIQTPGDAPADTLSAAGILAELQQPGGIARVKQKLTAARAKDSNVQLFPEITVGILGQGRMRVQDTKSAIEIFELNLLGYPDSADAHSDLADAYLAAGRTELARQHAEKALALLDSHAAPASSWSDTEPRRGEIRRGAERTLAKLRTTP